MKSETFTDPICGMKVDPETTAAVVERAGEKFYFAPNIAGMPSWPGKRRSARRRMPAVRANLIPRRRQLSRRRRANRRANISARCAKVWKAKRPAVVRSAAWPWSATRFITPRGRRSTPAQCTRRSSRIIPAIARSAGWRSSRRRQLPAVKTRPKRRKFARSRANSGSRLPSPCRYS